MVAELRARTLAGELGEINAVSGGFLSWDSNHNDWGWGFDPEVAGTSYATADLGVHWLDLAEYVTGRRITEVDARFSTLRPTRYRDGEPVRVDAEDYVRVFVELTGGVVGSATFSGVTAGEPNGCSINVDGTEGGFGWKVDRPNEIVHRRADGSVATIIRNPDALAPGAARLSFSPAGHVEGFGDAFRNLFRDFYSAIGGADVSYPLSTTAIAWLRSSRRSRRALALGGRSALTSFPVDELLAAPAAEAGERANAIELRGVSKIFGEAVALHPLDLDIRDGEFFLSAGPVGVR